MSVAGSDLYQEVITRFSGNERLYSIAGLATALLVIALTCLSVWRLRFHPLAHIPGPSLAAITDYYMTYYEILRNGATVYQLERLHAIYGPVVRIGPNKIHFSDIKAYDHIYRNNKFIKDHRFYNAFPTQESSFGFIDQRQAKERKEILRPLFSRSGVLRLEHVIQAVIDCFVDTLKQFSTASEDPLDLQLGFMAISMEVITTYCFAKSYDTLSAPGFRHPVAISQIQSLFPIFIIQHFPFLTPLLLGMPPWLAKILAPGAYHLQHVVQGLEDQIEEILKDPTSLDRAEHEIIYHHLLNPKTGAPPPSRHSLREEASVLVGAGSDTVANTCTICVVHILSNEAFEHRLREELLEAWPEVEDRMSLERLEKLPYLTAVIKESLRLSHGLVTPLPRVVTYETRIGDVLVPQNTIVEMGQTFVHLNPDIFPNPDRFDPSRWLGENSGDLEAYLVPFSKGPRSCLGINLAWAELYLILGNFFRKVDLELFETSASDLKFSAFFVPRYHNALRARVTGVRGTKDRF